MAAESQLFMVVDGVDNSQLWRSDGTSDGTYVLSNAYSDTDYGQATVVGDRLFFLASSRDAGEELWVSDGTVAGTGLVRDIVPGTQGCSLANMVSVDDTLYFSATDESGHRASAPPMNLVIVDYGKAMVRPKVHSSSKKRTLTRSVAVTA
jgi:ELWxxDGT repeat protein